MLLDCVASAELAHYRHTQSDPMPRPLLSYQAFNRRSAQIAFLRAVEQYAPEAIVALQELALRDPPNIIKAVRDWAKRYGFFDSIAGGVYIWVNLCAWVTISAWGTEEFRGTSMEWLCHPNPPQPGRWVTIRGCIPVGAELLPTEISQYIEQGVVFPEIEDADFIPLSHQLNEAGSLEVSGPDGSISIPVEDRYDTSIDLGEALYDPKVESRVSAIQRIWKTLRDDILPRRMKEIEIEGERSWRLERSKRFSVEKFKVLVYHDVLHCTASQIMNEFHYEESTVEQLLKEARLALGISRPKGRPPGRRESRQRRRASKK